MTPQEEQAVSRWQFSMIEKVVGASVIALLCWMAVTVQTTATRVAVIEAKLSAATEDRYTSTDAARDTQLTAARLEALGARVSVLEKRHGQ